MSATLHPSLFHPVLRRWSEIEMRSICPEALIYPLFISDNPNELAEIASMPQQKRIGIHHLREFLEPLVKKGLASVLLFGTLTDTPKDDRASAADDPNCPIIQAIQLIKQHFPDLLICCDLCLCPYTNHGHCGILNSDGTIHNLKSVKRLAEIGLAYAKAGCHVIAPSDMMDNRVHWIKKYLREAGLESQVSVMSYSAKFASSFYGPFRDAACSAPAFGDRHCYQLPPNSRSLARRAIKRDVEEGADFLMVKPGYPYLDIVRDARDIAPDHPLAVYQISGEYAMLWHAAANNVMPLKVGVMESLNACIRAGANIIITYYTPMYSEFNTFAQSLSRNSTFFKYESIGRTYQGRDILAITATNPNGRMYYADRKTVLLVSMIRAKEVVGMMTLGGMMDQIYNDVQLNLPTMTSFLETHKLIFVPLLNPDAYVDVVENKALTGSALVKNRRMTCPNNSSQSGVNLGHNFGFEWDIDGKTQPFKKVAYEDPCNPNYHGTYAFSEPESLALKNLIDTVDPTCVLFYHQRANSEVARIIYPFTYHPSTLKVISKEDASVIKKMVDILNKDNIYEVGSSTDLLGHTISGSELDWTFNQGIFSLVILVGSEGELPFEKNIAYYSMPHIATFIDSLPLLGELPKRMQAPPKSNTFWSIFLYFPLIMALIGGSLLLGGYLSARYLGYDEIWDRFKAFIHHIRMIPVYRQYQAVNFDAREDELDSFDIARDNRVI